MDAFWTQLLIVQQVARRRSPVKRWKSLQLLLMHPRGLEPAAFGFCANEHILHKVKAPRANRPRGLHYLARPRGFEPLAFGFVEDIHVSSNTCKDVQACANTGSVSDEKSKNVQAHASLSKDFAGSLLDGVRPTESGAHAGSLLDGPASDDEALRSVGKILTVRQVAKLLGVCTATVYRLCERGALPHYRIRNAIRVDLAAVRAMLHRSRAPHYR